MKPKKVLTKLRNRKNITPGSKAHALEHVHMRYVLYGFLGLLLGGLTYVLVSGTKPRQNIVDVLGSQTMGTSGKCLGQTNYRSMAGTIVGLDFDARELKVKNNGDNQVKEYQLAGSVSIYDSNCKRVPARNFKVGDKAHYYLDKDLISAIEAD